MELIRFTFRIPKDLNKWLVQQAKFHNRSKTQEIVHILKLAKARAEAMGNSSQDERWLSVKGDR